MKYRNLIGRWPGYNSTTYIYDDNVRTKHNFEIELIPYDSSKSRRLNIPGVIMLRIGIYNYQQTNGWLSIHIKPHMVTFKSKNSDEEKEKEDSQNMEDCSGETIVESILSYLDYFSSIKSEDCFKEAWKEIEEELKEEINNFLNMWRNFDIDTEIKEISQRIKHVKNRFAEHKDTLCEVQRNEYLQQFQTQSGVPVVCAAEFVKMRLDCDAQGEIDDLTDYLEALQNLQSEMTK